MSCKEFVDLKTGKKHKYSAEAVAKLKKSYADKGVGRVMFYAKQCVLGQISDYRKFALDNGTIVAKAPAKKAVAKKSPKKVPSRKSASKSGSKSSSSKKSPKKVATRKSASKSGSKSSSSKKSPKKVVAKTPVAKKTAAKKGVPKKIGCLTT